MPEQRSDDVTLHTLHEDLTAGFTEMRSSFADLKVTLVTGFRGLPTRESSEEMVRLLREGNRLNEERLSQVDLRIREQHLETQQVLHAVVEGQRLLIDGQGSLIDGQRQLADAQRSMIEEHRSLSADIKALIARIDALIQRRGNGGPTD